MPHLIFKSGLSNFWFTSDSHYWHTNMCYSDSVWSDKETSTRRFKDTKEMSDHIVNQINKYVKEDDILFHLGDWSFSGIQNIWNFRRRLLCKNIYLVIGNHDTHIGKNIFLPNCIYDNGKINSCKTKSDYHEDNWVKAHEIFSGVFDYLEIQIDKDLLCLMHYPIASWNRGFIMVHGHTHGNYPIVKNRLDVSIDNAFKLFNEYRPFTLSDILGIKDEDQLNDIFAY